MKGLASQGFLQQMYPGNVVRAPFLPHLYARYGFRRGVALLGVEAPVGAPLLFLPAVFTILGVEAPAGAPLLLFPVVFTIMGVQGVSIFLGLLFLTMQTLVGAHCLGP